MSNPAVHALPRILEETGPERPVSDVQTIVTRVSEIIAKRVEWFWLKRIPLGMVTMIDGDPGLGKSTLTLDLAARVTRGKPMPDGTPGPPPSGVVILSAEDDLARVIRPRLERAGADLERVATLTLRTRNDERDPVISPDDLAAIEPTVTDLNAKLIVIDPFVAYLPQDVNSHVDQDVRRVLKPLARFAERTGAAIVGIRHFTKVHGGNPVKVGGGSIGISGAARSQLIVVKDPDDETRRVFAVGKCNLAPPAPSLRFSLEGDDDGPARIRWEGTSPCSAQDLLAHPSDDDRGALREAVEFLHTLLADGPVTAKQGLAEARSAGISQRTLERARVASGVDSCHPANPGPWYWMLPATTNQTAEHLNGGPK